MSTCGEGTTLPGPALAKRRDPRSPLFSRHRTLWLTLVLLVAVTLLAVFELSGVMGRISPRDRLVAWTVCALLVSLAIAVLLLGRYMAQRSLEHIEIQLRELIQNDALLEQLDTAIPDDLKPVMTALNDYVALVRGRMEQLREQGRSLDLQMQAVEAAKWHVETVIHSICDPVLAVDSQGRLSLANNAAEQIFGLRFASTWSKPIEEVLNDPALVALLQDGRAIGEHRHQRQIEHLIGPPGACRTFKITLSTVIGAAGRPEGLVAVFHDVTREREISQLKTDFVSAVSHELRTPLSGIRAYVEMLVDDEAHSESQRREFYRIIENETDRLQRLVSNILNISRIEAGVLPIHRERVRINDVTRNVVAALAPQAREKSLLLDFEAGEGLPCLRADRDLLHEAVMNVIGNAIKYTPRGGHVRVVTGLHDDGSRLAVTVADNGMGIHPEDLPRVFDKFYRARGSAGAAKGTGLGLNLVRQIVETIHQGEIQVASEHGRGTTMSLRFPISSETGVNS
jgi:two-component system phosphate regulon sensor histidine kinase PhoR